MVHQIAHTGLSDLVETGEFVKVKRISIRHDAAMECHKQPLLIGAVYRAYRAETSRALRNQKPLMILRPNSVVSMVLIGPANAPLIRFVRTVSSTVPSKMRYSLPVYWSQLYLSFLESALLRVHSPHRWAGDCRPFSLTPSNGSLSVGSGRAR